MTKYVYRVQNKDGQGPYNSSHIWRSIPHIKENNRPTPCEENLGDILFMMKKEFGGKNVLFGFTKLTNLRKWFTKKELENLKEIGYVIYKFKAKEITEGERQCIFVPNGKGIKYNFKKENKMPRDIKDVMIKVMDLIPIDFEDREYLIRDIKRIGKDSFWKAPEVLCQSWVDFGDILECYLEPNNDEDWILKIKQIMGDV